MSQMFSLLPISRLALMTKQNKNVFKKVKLSNFSNFLDKQNFVEKEGIPNRVQTMAE